MRYRIVLSYDGTPFCGWQHQASGGSVQDAVEEAVFKLFGRRSRVTGSGRTDAGVHAIAQVAHFDVDKPLPEKNVVSGLNAYLPRAIRVTGASAASDGFDARKSAHGKTYMYLMYTGDSLPVLDDCALHLDFSPDLDAFNRAAADVVGTHDFSTFMASGSSAKTFVRTVTRAHAERCGRFVCFYIAADGFLYNMVRIITAQLVKASRGERVDMADLISRRDRAFAKDIAPACGLYLYCVDYGQ